MRIPTPPKYVAFGGSGVAMGGQKMAPEPVIQKVNVDDSKGKPVVNTSKPTTIINLRLHHGQTIKLDLNTDHTVNDLYNYCKVVAPAAKGATFNLIAGYPPKALTDMKATLESAGLLKSAVQQKLV